MPQSFRAVISGVVLLAAIIVPSLASAQAVSLQEQLAAQYKPVKMGSDSNGAAVVEAGTILKIQKGGILSVAYGDANALATKYQDGTVHSPNALVSKGFGSLMNKVGKTQTTALMQVGTKVYPSKIAVDLQKDQVKFSIVACDSCNNTSPTTFNKADVIFQFAKGSLATASAGQVEDTIAGLLAIDDSGGDQGNNQGNNNGQQGGNDQGNNQGGGGGQAQQQAAPAEPQSIEKGQTTDEVVAAIGQPDKKINLGAKQIYVYKDIKVTFMNGKVSDVQ
ncbi:MAG: hypothetical protein WAJ97_16390 [Terriglobales bacterium]|jgi:hypothetical protein